MKKVISILILVVISGCTTGKIVVEEPAFKITIKDTGDGEFIRNFHYQGESEEEPWIMTLNSQTEITSPGIVILAEAVRVFAEQMPGVIEASIPVVGQYNGSLDWASKMVNFLGSR